MPRPPRTAKPGETTGTGPNTNRGGGVHQLKHDIVNRGFEDPTAGIDATVGNQSEPVEPAKVGGPNASVDTQTPLGTATTTPSAVDGEDSAVAAAGDQKAPASATPDFVPDDTGPGSTNKASGVLTGFESNTHAAATDKSSVESQTVALNDELQQVIDVGLSGDAQAVNDFIQKLPALVVPNIADLITGDNGFLTMLPSMTASLTSTQVKSIQTYNMNLVTRQAVEQVGLALANGEIDAKQGKELQTHIINEQTRLAERMATVNYDNTKERDAALVETTRATHRINSIVTRQQAQILARTDQKIAEELAVFTNALNTGSTLEINEARSKLDISVNAARIQKEGDVRFEVDSKLQEQAFGNSKELLAIQEQITIAEEERKPELIRQEAQIKADITLELQTNLNEQVYAHDKELIELNAERASASAEDQADIDIRVEARKLELQNDMRIQIEQETTINVGETVDYAAEMAGWQAAIFETGKLTGVERVTAIETTLRGALPTLPSEIVFNPATGTFDNATGFEGRQRSPETIRRMAQLKPIYEAYEAMKVVADRVRQLEIERDFDMQEAQDSAALFREHMATGDIDSMAEVNAKRELFEMGQSRKENELEIGKMLMEAASNPAAMAMMKHTGMLARFESIIGVKIRFGEGMAQNLPPEGDLASPALWDSLTTYERMITQANWMSMHGGDEEDFKIAMAQQVTGGPVFTGGFNIGA